MKKLPPFGFTLALLFWAWQSGHWLATVAAAVWLEWVVRTSRRWPLGEKEIHRIVDLTSLALIAVALFQYQSGPIAESIFTILHWSPLLFLPLLSAQLLSGRSGLQQRALYYSKRNSGDPAAKREVDLTLPYFTACLLAAGQDSAEPVAYLTGIVAILAWLLWWNRPRHRNITAWVLLLSLAAGLGYLGQKGLRHAQTELENAAVEWLANLLTDNTDPYRARTALGDIGTLKLSDKILYRVESEQPLAAPLLLRTASYNRYVDTTWFNRQRNFIEEQAKGNGDSWRWRLGGNDKGSSRVRISAYLEEKQTILPLPTATWGIDQLPVTELAHHPLGAVRVGEGPGLVRYLAHFDQAASTDAPPGDADLRIPKQEQADLAIRLGLHGLTADRAMRRIKDYFQQQFSYSLELPGRQFGQTALSHFLLERRRGHCEYFASATVLLLRQAGIPARYAVGYSTQEASGTGHYVVRLNHAHAWAMAWHNGKWWDLDTTPSTWYQQEADAAPLWQPLFDFISDLYYRYALLQLTPRDGQWNPWLWGLLALLFMSLGYRLRPGKGFRILRKNRERLGKRWPDTPLTTIEAVLQQAGFPRQPWETYRGWTQRLKKEPLLDGIVGELEEIVRLHYRLRYRDNGLDRAESERMQQLAQKWLGSWDIKAIEQQLRRGAEERVDT